LGLFKHGFGGKKMDFFTFGKKRPRSIAPSEKQLKTLFFAGFFTFQVLNARAHEFMSVWKPVESGEYAHIYLLPQKKIENQKLLEKFSEFKKGITATASGFYAPQGRELRIKPAIEDLHQKMNTFQFKGNRITNFEMETSALYFLGKALGHNTLTICAIIGNRITQKQSQDYKKTVDKLILAVLEKF